MKIVTDQSFYRPFTYIDSIMKGPDFFFIVVSDDQYGTLFGLILLKFIEINFLCAI